MPISPLADLMGSLSDKPLLAVGSGGSFTVATLAAMLHESATHHVGKASTPYQSLADPSLLDANAILISAGGRNSDSIAAFKGLSRRITGRLGVITGSPNSKLAQLAFNDSGTKLFSFSPPFGRDGFLATNSLVATSVLIARAHKVFTLRTDEESSSLGRTPQWVTNPENAHFLKEVMEQETLVVLAGSWAWPAAVDLESKFSEGGLTHVQIADYRNFAHGRHFWLAKRSNSTAVIALVCPETEGIVERTLATLPDSVKSFTLRTNLTGAAGAIDLICQGMHFAGLAGEALDTSLAKPGVPKFGRRLYGSGFRDHKSQSLADVCVARKVMAIGLNSDATQEMALKSLKEFLTNLSNAHIEALVTDYDGTIYDNSKVQTLPSLDVQKQLIRLLDDGLILGVATGRGYSVVRELQRFLPNQFWHQVIVGCYGGASVSRLSHVRNLESSQDESLRTARHLLNSKLSGLDVQFDLNPQLLSIRPAATADLSRLRSMILENLNGRIDDRRIVQSAHSIDILGTLASKLRVVESVVELTRSKDTSAILRMGDQGSWGGNDYDLLSDGPSLSVDQVSADLETCWNIAEPGRRSSLAAASYLKALRKRGHAFRFNVKWTDFNLRTTEE